MKTYRDKGQRCPACGHILDAHTPVDDDQDARPPQPGDVTLCLNCAAALVHEPGGLLRRMGGKEFESLEPEVKATLWRAAEAIARKKRNESN